jgi:hypothetical protein
MGFCASVALVCAAGPALAQTAQAGTSAAPANPADQLVGLFGATCLHYPGDPAGVRGFLTQQGAPAMPAQARDAFLAGRAGQVFDTSVPGVDLAVVSLDDGGCEAIAEHAAADGQGCWRDAEPGGRAGRYGAEWCAPYGIRAGCERAADACAVVDGPGAAAGGDHAGAEVRKESPLF